MDDTKCVDIYTDIYVQRKNLLKIKFSKLEIKGNFLILKASYSKFIK